MSRHPAIWHNADMAPDPTPDRPAPSPARTRIGRGGRVVIPAEHRRALDLQPGDEVVVRVDDGQVRIFSLPSALRRAQAVVRRHVRPGESVVDELQRDRRKEAAAE
jgi:AbrB family looped-hinge helix DNA binding protein